MMKLQGSLGYCFYYIDCSYNMNMIHLENLPRRKVSYLMSDCVFLFWSCDVYTDDVFNRYLLVHITWSWHFYNSMTLNIHLYIYLLVHSIKLTPLLEGEGMSPPTACLVLPTLDRGAKLFSGKTGYESWMVSDYLSSKKQYLLSDASKEQKTKSLENNAYQI